jgi:O-antigen/teichoic acid export membrane protein
LALTGSETASRLRPRAPLAELWARLQSRLGAADQLVVHRLAGAVFLMRVASAALVYLSSVLFARWMGTFEFGVFVYVWTWVLLIGSALDLGLGTAAQRFIPEYRERGQIELLRGYLSRTRWLALGYALIATLLCAGTVYLLSPYLDHFTVIPLYVACVALPAFAVGSVQDGIARSYDWVGLAIVPAYIARQLLLTALMAAAYFGGLPVNAITAIALSAVAFWLPMLVQTIMLNRRLTARVAPGPKTHDVGLWIRTGLPILMAESFYLLLTHTDLLMLEQFRSPDHVAVYYAAVKTLALVAFIHFSVAAAMAHRVAAYHAAGDRAALATFIRKAMHLTFWPSLAAIALLLLCGKPILALFGPEFTEGYHLMFILAVGLLARATIGPMERFCNVMGEQRICAAVYGGAFAVNIGLCFLLIPPFGAAGAAFAISTALIIETVALVMLLKWRMKLNVFVWG